VTGDLFSSGSSSAVISSCGLFRYRLERPGSGEGSTLVIMVNPSTADASEDDATIRKLKGFSERRQWGRLLVGNLFAFRATDVRALAEASDPVGPDNDAHLVSMMQQADRVIFGWGRLSKIPRRWRHRINDVASLVASNRPRHDPLMIGPPTDCGQPRHPLMLAYSLPLLPWMPANG
jgi:hypothetical protein